MHAVVAEDCTISDDVEIGLRYADDCDKAVIGSGATIRSGTRIYADVTIGEQLTTGHDALIREATTVGNHVVVGTDVVVEGHTEIGDCVKIETGGFLPTHTTVGSDVFIGPHAVLTNDRYPQRRRREYEPDGPTLHDGVSVGANATVLPGVEIGEGAMVGAGSVVTQDVPAWHQAIGVPATIEPLPDSLRERNRGVDE